jgi:hypothetical protein
MPKEIHIANEYKGKRYRKGKIGTIWWSEIDVEGDVTMSEDFLSADWLTKADALSDVIALLTREYNNIIKVKKDQLNG